MSIRVRLNILVAAFLAMSAVVGALSLVAVDRYAQALELVTHTYQRGQQIADLRSSVYREQLVEADIRLADYVNESEVISRTIFRRLDELTSRAASEDERQAAERVQARYDEWYLLGTPTTMLALTRRQRELIAELARDHSERKSERCGSIWTALDDRLRIVREIRPDAQAADALDAAQLQTMACRRMFAGLVGPLHAEEVAQCDAALDSIDVAITQLARELVKVDDGNDQSIEQALAATRNKALGRLEASIESLRRTILNEAERLVGERGMTGFYARAVVGAAFALVLIGGVVASLMLRRWVVKRLTAMSQAAGRIGSGDLDYRINMPGRDEVAYLANQFDDMAAKLKQHQGRLLEAKELATLGAISSSVAHGMRNPLAGIRASAQLIVSRHREDAALVEALRDIIEEVDRLNDRISKLVYLARQGHMELVDLPASELLEAAREESGALLARRQVNLEVDDRTNGARVRVDPDKMAQTLAELISNAAHHSSPGTRVRLSSTCDDASVTYRVIDEGSGIEPKVREQIFDLFFSTRPQGTGMGLTCAKRIIEVHGGTLSLDSQVGVGTEVEVRLPRVPGHGNLSSE